MNDASADPEIVRQWWGRWPDANIAIATGAESGLVVLDVDVTDDKRGDRTLVELVRDRGPLGDTLHALTGSAGSHFYFAHPGGRVGNSAGRLGRGLDTRGDGGYVVAPPSVHASGHRYTWCAGGELAPLPAWLLELLLPKPAPVRPADYDRRPRVEAVVRASAYLEALPPAIAGSGGHDATMRAAVALVCGFDLGEADALDLLEHEYSPRCSPPWSRRELAHKVASAARANRVGRGYTLCVGGAISPSSSPSVRWIAFKVACPAKKARASAGSGAGERRRATCARTSSADLVTRSSRSK